MIVVEDIGWLLFRIVSIKTPSTNENQKNLIILDKVRSFRVPETLFMTSIKYERR